MLRTIQGSMLRTIRGQGPWVGAYKGQVNGVTHQHDAGFLPSISCNLSTWPLLVLCSQQGACVG